MGVNFVMAHGRIFGICRHGADRIGRKPDEVFEL